MPTLPIEAAIVAHFVLMAACGWAHDAARYVGMPRLAWFTLALAAFNWAAGVSAAAGWR